MRNYFYLFKFLVLKPGSQFTQHFRAVEFISRYLPSILFDSKYANVCS